MFLASAAWGIRVLLGGLLALIIGVTVERILLLRRHRTAIDADAASLSGFLADEDIDGAIAHFSNARSVTAQLTTVALDCFDKGAGAVEQVSQGAALIMRERLERGLTLLATLGNNAPFIGLLGTVLGIVMAFGSLGQNADSEFLMGAISEALIATAIGLAVALPAVVAYNHLQRHVDRMLAESEALCRLVAAHAGKEVSHGR